MGCYKLNKIILPLSSALLVPFQPNVNDSSLLRSELPPLQTVVALERKYITVRTRKALVKDEVT